MREIKFRAWDQERKMMVDGNEIEEAEQPYEEEGCYIAQITRYQTGLSYGKVFIAYTDNRGDFTECEVMQFTGLHDKNGKEIYEGDIMHNEHGDPDCSVVFYNGSFGVDTTDGWEDLINLTKNGEVVIGNIYEHSHILK